MDEVDEEPRRQGRGRDRRLRLRRQVRRAQHAARSTASSAPFARPRKFSATSEAEWQRLAPRIGVSDPTRPDSRFIASAIARASRAGRSRTRRPTRDALSRARRDRRHRSRRDGERAGHRHLLQARKADLKVGRKARLARSAAGGLVCGRADRGTAAAARAADGRCSQSDTRHSSGALFFNLGVTLARVAVAFTIAMALGAALGLAMGRSRLADRLGDPWLWCCSTCRRW